MATVKKKRRLTGSSGGGDKNKSNNTQGSVDACRNETTPDHLNCVLFKREDRTVRFAYDHIKQEDTDSDDEVGNGHHVYAKTNHGWHSK